MKLAILDGTRPVVIDDDTFVDVSDALPADDPTTFAAGWWRGLVSGFSDLRPAIERAAATNQRQPLDLSRLSAPALNPSKILACASNYRAHVEEMHGVQERTLGTVHPWMMDFDVFLKAPSSLTGPADQIILPSDVVDAGLEIHHESELVIVIGQGGKDLPVESALDAVLGYTIGLDITVRGDGDRSRRKSYDTFSPLGPWITTSDEADDPDDFAIRLVLNGSEVRQDVNTRDLITSVPEIVSYASRAMTLLPGDLIFTGAPPGVGPIVSGDLLDVSISSLGSMTIGVR